MKVRGIFAHWDEVRTGLEKTLLSLPPERLDFRPIENALSIGDIFRHIAGAEVHWIQKIVLGNWQTNARFSREDYNSNQAIFDLLRKTHQPTCELLDSLDEKDLDRICSDKKGEEFTIYWILWHVLEHEIHHKGQIFRDLRSLGEPASELHGP
ncbi:MAG: DinB family protein [Candidatus Thorarchaeota archaeon]